MTTKQTKLNDWLLLTLFLVRECRSGTAPPLSNLLILYNDDYCETKGQQLFMDAVDALDPTILTVLSAVDVRR